MDFKYSFVSTHQDLIDSYTAIKNHQSGLSTWSRSLILLLGFMWLFGFLFLSPSVDNFIQPLIWLSLGCLIIWKVALKPFLEVKQIKEASDPEQQVDLVFHDDGIEITAEEGVKVFRRWEELEEFHSFKKGIFFGFSDGAASWLPLRVFSTKEEKQGFIQSIINKFEQA
ncbi:YcxB family protein [Neptuniibacter sp. QD48_55]|uniref:YcxB family protein n=1 Tax=Neptuniibacter sp. QD48_55 TaxID=3398212 RepID=UPI0039F48253